MTTNRWRLSTALTTLEAMSANLEAMLQAAAHDDERIRQEAALQLGTFAPDSAAGDIVSCLLAETDDFVLETLTWAVVAHAEAAVPHLLAALQDPDTGKVRVLHALSKIEDPGTVAAVTPFAADERPAVASRAWWALARIGRPESIPVLLGHVGIADIAQRQSLGRALAHLGPQTLPGLTELLAHQDASIRAQAAEFMVRVLDPSTRSTRSRLRPEPTETEQIEAGTRALIAAPAEEVGEVLTELALDFQHPDLVETAQQILDARAARD